MTNLEPVHEVPFEGKIPIEDEEKWEKVPKEQISSAFKQYRKEVSTRKLKGGICCGGHLAVTYGGELLYLPIFS